MNVLRSRNTLRRRIKPKENLCHITQSSHGAVGKRGLSDAKEAESMAVQAEALSNHTRQGSMCCKDLNDFVWHIKLVPKI